MKYSGKISSFLFLIALLLVLALGSCAKTELNDFITIETADQNKHFSKGDATVFDRNEDNDDDDFVTDDEDDDEEEEDDTKK